MDAYMRIANCRILAKMLEDPAYSKQLGLELESHYFDNNLVNRTDKEESGKSYGKQKRS